jgi:glutamate-1-semialdehyde 2,1-aminomutase
MEFEGTFNGNPLSMVAAKAVLSEILRPDVYPRFDELGAFYADGLRDHVARRGLPAIVTAVGCRGSVHFRAEPVRDFRDAVDVDDRLARLAWLYQLNAGVFVPSGDPWTFSVAHAEEDLWRSIDAFGTFAADVAS